MSRGLGSFFLGGIIYHLYAFLVARKSVGLIINVLAITTLGLWATAVLCSYYDVLPAAPPIDPVAMAYFPSIILFPLTILALALFETHRGNPARRIAFLGDISYSSYLWHFPLQLLFVLVVPLFGATMDFSDSVAGLAVYFSCLIALSLASFRYFEMPVQRQIRRAWLTSPSVQP
jgi:peptidoglycan/LPS O-acetylase OafA/YrhL